MSCRDGKPADGALTPRPARVSRRWTWLLCWLILSQVPLGCEGTDRPRDLYKKPRPDLKPYDTEEQARRIRGRFSIPQDDIRVGPRTGLERHTPVGW